MATYIAFHEVDDVEHWKGMPTRDELFGTIGATHRVFVDPEGSNRVGLILEIPDLDAFMALVQSPEGAAAMAKDGVRPETLVVLAEAGSED